MQPSAEKSRSTKPVGEEIQDLKAVPLGRASDEDLMRRTQEDDKQAYSLLYERYSASVLSYLYRMLGNVEDVESIAQEVFLRAYRFRATYRYPQRLSTWLFTITRNLAINQARRKKRSPVRNITELNLEGVDISGDPYRVAAAATDDLEKQEQIALMLKALDDLPTDQKEVIVLGVFQDLSYGEMEEITGTKAVTLRSRMFHGLKKLAKLMGAEEVSTLDADTDPFYQLLTDALRAGPGSPAWHEAVEKVRGGGVAGGNEYALLLDARENLESGKGYRQVRAGPNFTRKILAAIDEEQGPEGKIGGGHTPTIIAIAAGIVGLGVIVLLGLLLTSGNAPRRSQSLEDLQSQIFSREILSATFNGKTPAGWVAIGSLPQTMDQALRPPTTGPSSGYGGCGLAIATPIPADTPCAIEVALQVPDASSGVITQVFLSDQPDFNPDLSTSPHELDWILAPVGSHGALQQQVIYPDGTFAATGLLNHRPHETMVVRLAFNADYVLVDSDGKPLYAGEHRLSVDKPRYVGVRFLRSGNPGNLHKNQLPGIVSISVSQG